MSLYCSRLSSYSLGFRLGEGTFGEVFFAIHTRSGQAVALKRVRCNRLEEGVHKSVMREIYSLSLLSSLPLSASARPCPLLYDYFSHHSSVVICMEYCPTDLGKVLKTLRDIRQLCAEREKDREREREGEKEGKRATTAAQNASTFLCLPPSLIQYISYELLHCLHVTHSHSLIHRDVKPSNVLISKEGRIKLGDFGLCRVHSTASSAASPSSSSPVASSSPSSSSSSSSSSSPSPSPSPECYSHEVATRWYRSPELLYGSRVYSESMDMWACGVIVAELHTLSPLFPGINDIDQLYLVLQLMGSPTEERWPSAQSLPDFKKIHFEHMSPREMRDVFAERGVHIEEEALALLKALLQCEESRRLSAEEALKHAYFDRYQQRAKGEIEKEREDDGKKLISFIESINRMHQQLLSSR